MKMNLLNSFLIITILLFVQSLFYSCDSGNNSENNIEENTITSEENNHEKAVDSNIITSFFKGKNTLPFTVDSSYFETFLLMRTVQN